MEGENECCSLTLRRGTFLPLVWPTLPRTSWQNHRPQPYLLTWRKTWLLLRLLVPVASTFVSVTGVLSGRCCKELWQQRHDPRGGVPRSFNLFKRNDENKQKWEGSLVAHLRVKFHTLAEQQMKWVRVDRHPCKTSPTLQKERRFKLPSQFMPPKLCRIVMSGLINGSAFNQRRKRKCGRPLCISTTQM